MTDSLDQAELRKLRIMCGLVRSETGPHLARIERMALDHPAADDLIEFDLSLAGNFFRIRDGENVDIANASKAHLQVSFLDSSIDVQANVPAQVALQLLKWSEALRTIAAALNAIPSQPLKHEPLAHVLHDIETGEEVSGSPFYDHVAADLDDYTRATGHDCQIRSGRLTDFPEHVNDFMRMIEPVTQQDASGQPTKDEV